MDSATYTRLYQQSIKNPDQFWAEQAKQHLSWFKPWEKVKDCDLASGKVNWFTGAELNACHNCIDRHLEQHHDKVAYIWEAGEPGKSQSYTYQDLYEQVCRFANVLLKQGVRKGHRVCIYLPMIPEAVFAMLACARIGAVHSVVFAGFSPKALADRINDAGCKLLITADHGMRGGKAIALKDNADQAADNCPSIESVLVIRHSNTTINWHAATDQWFDEVAETVDSDCPVTPMDAEDPLFILYTSGSTGKPKGVVHTHAGYLLYTAVTHKTVFDLQDNDVYWCAADVGWITGHSYIVYGPLLNASTSIIFEGTPTYPTPARCWEIIDQHKVSIFYTSPTAIRALRREGDAYLTTTSRKTLRRLGSVGEPINPEAWQWYHDQVGNRRCHVVDTWWQTETGGVMIAPLTTTAPPKPGSATKPFWGIEPVLLDPHGDEIQGAGNGMLYIKQPWPGMLRTVYQNQARFLNAYLSPKPGYFATGDNAKRDSDGDYWITGRSDDVINVSGHRLGTAEIESALVSHPVVAEAAVVGMPHPIKGQGIYAFVSLRRNETPSAQLQAELVQQVRDVIGPIATPDCLHWAHGLPKTRSGKIMRRILRKIVERDIENIGDTSTLANPEVVEQLIGSSPSSG